MTVLRFSMGRAFRIVFVMSLFIAVLLSVLSPEILFILAPPSYYSAGTIVPLPARFGHPLLPCDVRAWPAYRQENGQDCTDTYCNRHIRGVVEPAAGALVRSGRGGLRRPCFHPQSCSSGGSLSRSACTLYPLPGGGWYYVACLAAAAVIPSHYVEGMTVAGITSKCVAVWRYYA